MSGNAVATLVVARWEGAFDQKKFDEFMKNPNLGSAPLQEPGTVLPAPDPRPVITSI